MTDSALTATAPATMTLDSITANIKLKLVENHVLTNAFNRNINHNSVEIGQWQNWLADNFQMTDQTARNYMKVAAYFGDDVDNFINHFGKFGAGSTPLKAKNPCLF